MNFASKSLRRALLSGIAFAPMALVAAPAHAQDADVDEQAPAEVDEVPESNVVIVTARRREEQGLGTVVEPGIGRVEEDRPHCFGRGRATRFTRHRHSMTAF